MHAWPVGNGLPFIVGSSETGQRLDRAIVAALPELTRGHAQGLIERGLSILEVTPNGPKVIAPPPARFSLGY